MHAEILTQAPSEDLSLQQLVQLIWPRRWFVIVVTGLITIGVGAASFIVPKEYEASVVVMPASSESAGGGSLGGLGGVASSLGGLASLAGLTIGDSARKAESVAVLQSEALTELYVERNNLLPILYKERWIPETHSWNTSDPKKVPTLWKANQKFKKQLRDVNTNTKNGIVTLTIKWKDPSLAAQWANGLVKVTNEYLRNKAISESERNIAYLNDEATKTTVVEAKQAIYAILQNEINKQMLARGSEEYALRVLDPAVAPERAVFPNKTLWVLGGGFGGLLLSCAWVVVSQRWRSALDGRVRTS